MPEQIEPKPVLPDPKPRADLSKEYHLRRKEFVEKRVATSDVADFVAEGWSVEREDTKRAIIRKRKPIGDRLEDRFWCALFKMGYEELSTGQAFNILVSKKNEPNIYKQVDVFAKDGETVIIAECKRAKHLRKDRFRKILMSSLLLRVRWLRPCGSIIRDLSRKLFGCSLRKM